MVATFGRVAEKKSTLELVLEAREAVGLQSSHWQEQLVECYRELGHYRIPATSTRIQG
jgi:hypothetical protein